MSPWHSPQVSIVLSSQTVRCSFLSTYVVNLELASAAESIALDHNEEGEDVNQFQASRRIKIPTAHAILCKRHISKKMSTARADPLQSYLTTMFDNRDENTDVLPGVPSYIYVTTMWPKSAFLPNYMIYLSATYCPAYVVHALWDELRAMINHRPNNTVIK